MKKFNKKLTLAVVSLFVGLILVALGQISKLFIMFGCFSLAVAFVLLAFFDQGRVAKTISATNEDVGGDSTITDDEFVQVEIAKQKFLKQHKKLQTSLFVGAVLMIILGFCALI